jgi:hypothetical protein
MFQQATQTYELPSQMAQSLAQFAAPTTPNSSFVNAPALNIQPANLIGATANAQTAAQNTYQDQQSQYNNMMSGLFGIGSGALGAMGSSGALAGLMGAMAL